MTKELEAEKNVLKERTEKANYKYFAAISQMREAVAEKTEVKNQINSLREIQLIQRESTLRKDISKLQYVNKQLQKESNDYKSGFVRAFVLENLSVQKDIVRFSRDGMKREMEDWLMDKFLFTALNRYHKYIESQSINLFGDLK